MIVELSVPTSTKAVSAEFVVERRNGDIDARILAAMRQNPLLSDQFSYSENHIF
jgi:hypothetical protein